MRALLTQVSVRRSGNVAHRARELDGDPIRIGRGMANEIILEGLSIALRHAEIVKRSDGVYLVPLPPESVLLRGRRIDGDVRLAPGDVIRIGAHEIRVQEVGGERDLSLEVQAVEPRASDLAGLRSRASMQLEQGPWSRRLLSWLAVGAVLAGGLLMPLASGRQASWSTGPISNNHASIADDCARCHTPFRRVRNDACLDCHRLTAAHAEDRESFAYLDALPCGGCHLEHRGPEGLAALEDARCASCHADLDGRHETRLASASDFGAHHPEFTLHMLRPVAAPAPGEAGVEVVRETWSADAREDSGLEFSHLKHVGGVRRADETQGTLRCEACHVVDEGGRRMAPIRFEEHCRSCHPLNYGYQSARLRDERAPHGKPGELLRQLRRAYLDDALPQEPGETGVEREQRRLRFTRPGRKRTPEEERLIQAVNDRAERAFALLMSDEYCGKCHTLLPEDDDLPSDVAPVALTRAWFGQARFDHSSHTSMRCGTCHPRAAAYDEEYEALTEGFARAPGTLAGEIPYGLVGAEELRALGLEPSDSASDVLMQGRDVCRECHAGSRARAPRVASPCVMCHPYHQPGEDPILERVRAPHPDA